MKADRGDSGSEIGLRIPEGDPDPENDLSPPPSAYPGRWAVHLIVFVYSVLIPKRQMLQTRKYYVHFKRRQTRKVSAND